MRWTVFHAHSSKLVDHCTCIALTSDFIHNAWSSAIKQGRKMTTKCIISCSFSSWYDTFRGYTIKSRILKLPEDVIKYLNEDGIVLPISSHGVNSRVGTEWDSDDDDLNEEWPEEESTASLKAPDFSQFDAKITSSIAALGGTVFPKLNWSSPKDATWIALNNTLECKTPADIYLLLKSSTFVAHDLTNPFDTGESSGGDAEAPPSFQYELVLRRWHTLSPGGEFRCFVKNRNLIGVCQRHYKNFFDHIKNDEKEIVEDILDFFTSVVKDNFPESNYVVDVYRKEKGKLYVMDFNPFCPVTDSLMFSWEELEGISTDLPTVEPHFRYVESDTGIATNPYQNCAVPQDFIDLTTGMDPNKLMDLLQMKIQNQGDESSSDDEEEDQQATSSSTSGSAATGPASTLS